MYKPFKVKNNFLYRLYIYYKFKWYKTWCFSIKQ